MFVQSADVERLVLESRAGSDTLAYLRAFDAANDRFESLNELMLAVRDAHAHALLLQQRRRAQAARRRLHRVGDEERNAVLAYMSGKECALFSEAFEVKATAADLDRIIIASGGRAAECVDLLMGLDRDGYKFQEFSEVLGPLELARERKTDPTAMQKASRDTLFAYLSGPACGLFSDAPSEVVATGRQLDILLELGGGLQTTLDILQTLDQAGQRFNVFDELLALDAGRGFEESKTQDQSGDSGGTVSDSRALVLAEHKEPEPQEEEEDDDEGDDGSVDASAEDRNVLLDFLSSKECELFREVEDVHVMRSQLDSMIHSSPLLALFFLKLFNDQGRRFHTFEALLYAVQSAEEQAVYKGQELLVYLTSHNCALLSSDVVIDQASVDLLYVQGGAGPDTIKHLISLDRESQYLGSLEALIDAVRSIHESGVAARKQLSAVKLATEKERKLIVQFLSSPECELFSEVDEIHVRKSDLDALTREAHSVPVALFHLKKFNTAGRRFTKFADLFPAMRDAVATGLDHKKQLYARLKSEGCRLLLRTPERELPVTKLFIDRVFMESGAGMQSMSILDTLQSQGKQVGARSHAYKLTLAPTITHTRTRIQYSRLEDLLTEVKLVWTEKLRLSVKPHEDPEKLRDVLAHLSSRDCLLFSESVDVQVCAPAY